MWKQILVFLGIVMILALAGTSESQTAEEAAATYKGSKKCKMCHKEEYKIWLESPHATAFERLEEADQAKEECVACHTTGHVAGGVEHAEPGIGCESCHGAASKYAAKGVMTKKAFKADPEGSKEMWYASGLIKPTEETCLGCHNDQSPDFKGFDLEEYMKNICHWETEEAEAAK